MSGFQPYEGPNEIVERLRAELASAIKQRDEATAWRPIETAPMDGTVVMLYGDGRVTCGSWIAEQDIMVSDHVGCYPSGETTPAYWQSHDGGFTEEHPATHWMPLPQPPRENEGGGDHGGGAPRDRVDSRDERVAHPGRAAGGTQDQPAQEDAHHEGGRMNDNDIDAPQQTLEDALPKEIERCQQLLVGYAKIGVAGAYARIMIRAHIAAAHKAMMEGDVVEMIRAYEALKGCK